MAKNRWGALRTMATAVRTAMRPGSPAMGERLASVPRLFLATFRGEYTGSTKGRLLLVLAGIAYVISPVDFVPEAFFSVFGLADDAMVMSWIAATIVNETESFLAWERTVPGSAGSAGSRAGAGGSSRAARETVDGHVVR